MQKKIVIIGGGISGLTALHYLNKKYNDSSSVSVQLLERENRVGGTIQSVEHNGVLYETGPNGFLDSKPSTLELAHDLGLDSELIAASSQTKVRYICRQNTLYPLPSDPISFLKFLPLRLRDKIRVAGEFFCAPGQNPNETVYEFGVRRLGEGFAANFLDPMVSGIFGGDARELNLRYAFPRIFEIEQTYGSLLKGMIALGLKKRKAHQKDSLTAGQPKGQLWSFKNGMAQLTATLADRYCEHIQTGVQVKTIRREGFGYSIETPNKKYFADELILAIPAYRAADLIASLDYQLANSLRTVVYNSIVVVGFKFSLEKLAVQPKGFGYLRLTSEGQEVLGVLFSSNIFTSRATHGDLVLQVMLGGVKHSGTVHRSDAELFEIAQRELANVLGITTVPEDQFLKRWPQAIPQYTRQYPQTRSAILMDLKGNPNLYLLANYLDGVSVNDCTANAKSLAEKI